MKLNIVLPWDGWDGKGSDYLRSILVPIALKPKPATKTNNVEGKW